MHRSEKQLVNTVRSILAQEERRELADEVALREGIGGGFRAPA
jgi:hypothetical protein